MSTSFNGITDATLQKFVDKMTTCVRFQSGSAPSAAPNAVRDRLQEVVSDQSKDITVTLRISGGDTAFIKVVPNDANPGWSIEGICDVTTLAAVLA